MEQCSWNGTFPSALFHSLSSAVPQNLTLHAFKPGVGEATDSGRAADVAEITASSSVNERAA